MSWRYSEDIDSAEALGINTVQARVSALALSAFLAGAAGGFYAMYFRYIDPDAVFSIALSVEMVFIRRGGRFDHGGGSTDRRNLPRFAWRDLPDTFHVGPLDFLWAFHDGGNPVHAGRHMG